MSFNILNYKKTSDDFDAYWTKNAIYKVQIIILHFFEVT